MKKILLTLSASAMMLCSCTQSDNADKSLKPIDQIDFSHVQITDSFWQPRLERHATTTLDVCIDQIENQTGRIRNFENAAKHEGEHSGIFFDDSDVYKAMEGIAYSLINQPNAELEQKADEWIAKFAAAQQPDGYINTFYTLTGLDKRWGDMDKHEMYCAGHMTEAAVAYYKATGKRQFLDVAIKMADHMMNTFGPDKRHWVPGHEEIELALVKLAAVTGEQKYSDFAYWLLEERGHGHGQGVGHGSVDGKAYWNKRYYQDSIPVSQLSSISGHAVRSMYLYCGMADVAVLRNDTSYVKALNRLWDDVVLRNMYVTGGIGSSAHNEGFTEDFDLPNKEAYCETCASIGMVYWNQRMYLMTGDSKYIDVLERSMYNGALAGVSLSGDRFFYVNPLESDGNHHRQAWYGCACCPSQVSRFLPSIGNYIYAQSADALWVNLFIGSNAKIDVDGEEATISIATEYPWNGHAEIVVDSPKPLNKALKVRIPGWCKSYAISVGDKAVTPEVDKGYAVINGVKPGEKVSIDMDMPVEMVAADPRVKADEGKRAIQRGPLVYCMEEVDNKATYNDVTVADATQFSIETAKVSIDDMTIIKASTAEGQEATLIPYYAWDNREAGKMKVWIDYTGTEK